MHPQVVIIDDVPADRRDRTGTSRRDDGHFHLVVAEMFWRDRSVEPFEHEAAATAGEPKLRLDRAIENAPAEPPRCSSLER